MLVSTFSAVHKPTSWSDITKSSGCHAESARCFGKLRRFGALQTSTAVEVRWNDFESPAIDRVGRARVRSPPRCCDGTDVATEASTLRHGACHGRCESLWTDVCKWPPVAADAKRSGIVERLHVVPRGRSVVVNCRPRKVPSMLPTHQSPRLGSPTPDQRASMIEFAIVVHIGGRKAEVRAHELVLGRSVYCSLVLDHPSISRVHASLRRVGDCCQVADLGSTNGTFINRRRIGREPVTVSSQDVIVVGQLSLKLELVQVSCSREMPTKDNEPYHRELNAQLPRVVAEDRDDPLAITSKSIAVPRDGK